MALVPMTLLAAAEEIMGREGCAELVGQWLAEYRHERPRPALAKPLKRALAPHYLAFVRTLPCIVCGKRPSEPDHHGPRGMSRKTDDYRVVPLCHQHHMERHNGHLHRSMGVTAEYLENYVHECMVTALVAYLRAVECWEQDA